MSPTMNVDYWVIRNAKTGEKIADSIGEGEPDLWLSFNDEGHAVISLNLEKKPNGDRN